MISRTIHDRQEREHRLGDPGHTRVRGRIVIPDLGMVGPGLQEHRIGDVDVLAHLVLAAIPRRRINHPGQVGAITDRDETRTRRIVGITAEGDLLAVGTTVSVAVHYKGIGSARSLDPIQQPISIGVRIRRIGFIGDLTRIAHPVFIGIRAGRIRATLVFLRICEAVFIKISFAQLVQVPWEELFLEAIGNAVPIRVEIGIETLHIDPPARAKPVAIELRP